MMEGTLHNIEVILLAMDLFIIVFGVTIVFILENIMNILKGGK